MAIVALAACDTDDPTPPQLAPEPDAALSVGLGANGLATSDPSEFADAVRGVGNGNELLVWFRGANESALSHDALADTRGTVVGLSSAHAARTRSGLKARPANAQARQAVVGMLQTHGVQPYSGGAVFPYVAIRVPDPALDAVSQALLNHPNIDFVEANQRRAAQTLGAAFPLDPQQDHDVKHTRHFVPEAWTFTRGSSQTTVGILDSGLAYDIAAGVWHPDAADLGSYGIQPRGFVDDMEWFSACTTSMIAAGTCIAWDDNTDKSGHGTRMVGLVGGNDNNIGFQGVMPDGRVYAMKVGFNTELPYMEKCRIDLPDGTVAAEEAFFCIEADDLLAALDWAVSNSVDILSMSWFLPRLEASEKAALQAAHEDHGILLLAALGNDPGDPGEDELVKQPYIAGVGAVGPDGQLRHQVNVQYLDLSASAGHTNQASCYSDSDFCTVGDTDESLFGFSMGTSAATAIAAGIAGLLLDEAPSLTADQLLARLQATARGDSTLMLDAEWALTNRSGLRARVTGASTITTAGSYRWSAYVTGGTTPYAYVWEITTNGGASWQNLGSGSQSNYWYVDEFHPDFEVRMKVTSDGRTLYRSKHVSVNIDTGSCTPIPPAVTC